MAAARVEGICGAGGSGGQISAFAVDRLGFFFTASRARPVQMSIERSRKRQGLSLSRDCVSFFPGRCLPISANANVH
jgi:hypothetical protein